MLLCLVELPVRFLWCWLLLFIHFCSSFCCCCSSFILFFILLLLFFISLLLIWWCTSHCFSTSSLTLSWTIAGFLHPFYTFSPVHCRVICEPFIFNLFEIFFSHFYRERYGFVWAFFTHRRFFTLRSFTDITCVYQGLPGSWQFFLGVWRVSYWSSKHRPGPSFVWFTVIHNLHIQNDSFLSPTKHYHELIAVKSLVYKLLTCFELFLLVQTYVNTIKKHFEQDLLLLITASMNIKVILKKQPPEKKPSVI